MTAPGLAHRKRSGETNPFEVNVSIPIEHYITPGLVLHTLFPERLGDIMRKMKNLKGQKFGRLTAICPVGKNRQGAILWLCNCDCGNDTVVEGRSLTSGATRSCGCLDREAHKFRPNRTIHGKSGTRLYRIWKKMKSRCSNPNDPDYQQYYGSRGITVCPEWLNDFQAFYDWAMSHGYSDELSIDRIDNEKGYSSDNCRWATAEEQRHNQRREGGGSHS